MTKSDPSADKWLLLIHQFPAKPAYLRVKVWRRLQAIGAAQVKNAVYALPASDQNRERLSDLLAEIVGGGGEALVCWTRLIEGLSDTDMRDLFDAARDADYDELVQQARTLLAAESISSAELARLRSRRDEIAAIDFFCAHGRQTADAILGEVDDKAHRHPDVSRREPPPAFALSELRKRVWVTRRGVHVDRIASAWLIRRFIDSEATFKFVDSRGYVPEEGELRFDMADAEFTHEGDRCTFETLLSHASLQGDTALAALGEIVHELDIKDGKFSRPEAAGVSAFVTGICAGTANDEERVARGASAFDALYSHFSQSRGQ